MASYGLVDPKLEELLRLLQTSSVWDSELLKKAEAAPWTRPALNEKFKGELRTALDMLNIHDAFYLEKVEEAFIKAFSKENPGNTGDATLPLQIEYATMMERAYRARHTQNFPRQVAHVVSRKKGHGADTTGVFTGQILGYFQRLVQQSAEGAGGEV